MLAVPLGLGVLALQLRHSFAIARGRRPRGALWSLLALAVLVYLPIPWLGWGWVPMQASLMASMPLALRGRPLAVALAVPVVGTDLAVIRLFADRPAATVGYWSSSRRSRWWCCRRPCTRRHAWSGCWRSST